MSLPVVTPFTALVAGVDQLTPGQREADGLVHALVERLGDAAIDATVATHWARVGELRHVALSLQLPGDGEAGWQLLLAALPDRQTTGLWAGGRHAGPADLREPARAAAQAHATRTSGRVVHFPGVVELVGTLPVREVLNRSAIDRVHVLTVGDADPDAPVVTRDFVRPTWSGGELVLVVQPAVGGTLRPYEVPDPTPCCAAHG